MAELSYESGYEGLTASDVIAASGVARSAFYAFFDSKRECAEAAHGVALQGLVSRVEAARTPAGRWREGVGETLGVLARDLASNPQLAHLVVVVGSALRLEVPGLDPARCLLAPLAAPGAPDGPAGSRTKTASPGSPAGESAHLRRATAIARATVWDLLLGEVRARRAGELPERLEQLAFAALCPYLGAAAAFDEAPALADEARAVSSPERPWTLFDPGVGELPRPTAERLEDIRVAGDLRHEDLARALGVSSRTISRWLAGGLEPSPSVAARIAGSLRALERIVELLPDPSVREWLLDGNPALEGRPPVEALAAGEHARVRAAVEALEGAGASIGYPSRGGP